MDANGQSHNLDIVRSAAIAAVLFDHFSRQAGFNQFGRIGRAGVLIFFVHTALVLMFSLNRLASRSSQVSKAFYIQRAFRIFPLCWFAILLALAFHIPLAHVGATYRWNGWMWVVENFLLVQNVTFASFVIGPMWSLPYEIQMYLVLPAIHRVVCKKKYPLVWIGGICLASAAITVLLNRLYISIYGLYYDDSLHSPITNFVPCFMGGVLAFVLSRRKHLSLSPMVLAPALSLFIWMIFRPPFWHEDWAACLLMGALLPQIREVEFRPLQYITHNLAQYSYGIYLFHVPVLWLVFTVWALPGTIGWPVVVLLIGGCSYAGYVFIEHPAVKQGHALAKQLARQRHPIAA